jgi:hypothetical protein
MSKELPAVDLENVLEVDISKIALDDRFGSLKFDNANKISILPSCCFQIKQTK